MFSHSYFVPLGKISHKMYLFVKRRSKNITSKLKLIRFTAGTVLRQFIGGNLKHHRYRYWPLREI